MTKNVQGVLLKKSNVKIEGEPKLPAASGMVEGELAINYAEGVETLSTKNSSGDVVTFSSDDYYTSKKLGDYFTGENSAKTVTDVMIEKERVTAEALIDLDSRKVDFDDMKELWHEGVEGSDNGAVKLYPYSTASGNYSVAEGYSTTASGQYSHAEGGWTTASGYEAHAEGYSTTASGDCSHAEGSSTQATGNSSHAEGYYTRATGDYTHAEGYYTTASTTGAHAEGYKTRATYSYAHAEGSSTTASSINSHAEGSNTLANGSQAHAEGSNTNAAGTASHAEGSSTYAYGNHSHAEGYNTSATGQSSHSEGETTRAWASYAHAEGYGTTASTSGAHAEGLYSKARGQYCHAEGTRTDAWGNYSHAEGEYTTGNSYASHVEGGYTQTNGKYAHAEGYGSTANGMYSHAEGESTKALGEGAHTEGYRTTGTSAYTHAEGIYTQAIEMYSHAEGEYTSAMTRASHVEGGYTRTSNKYEHASGYWNVSNSASTTWGDSGNTLFSVGNGTGRDARHNAFEIRQNGDIYIVSGSSDIKLQDYLGGGGASITVDQVMDETTSASTNPVATQAVYDVYHEFETVISAAINDLEARKLDENDVEQVINSVTSGSPLPVSTSAVCQYIDSHSPASSVNADWDETDETSPAFILNKPFGDSCEYVTAYENTFTAQTVGPADYGIGGWSFSGAGTTFRYGDTYRITINGNVYVRNAIYFSGTYLGLNIEEGAENPYTNTWSIFNSGANVFASKEIALGDTVYLKVEQLICTTTLIDNKYVNSSWERGTGVNSVKLIDNGGTASGELSVSEGSGTTASGKYAHAEGYKSKASGNYSHAEGSQTSALTNDSHAEGLLTIANGGHAEGYGSNSNGTGAHAEGYYTEAHAVAHAEGDRTKAKGYSSHAEGTFTVANGGDSHAEGNHTVTNNGYEHASGFYNVSSSASTEFGHSGNTLFSVGNGTYNEQTGASTRHNAFEIRQNGDIYIVNKYGADVRLQDEIGGGGSITIDQTIDSGTSASTNAVATKAVYSAITSNERIVSAALNDLNTNKFDTSAFTVYSGSVETTYVKKTDVDQVIDSTTSGSSDAVSTSAVYGFVTSYTPSITVDQVLDNAHSASTNPVSSKAVYDAVTDNELVWANAYVAMSGAISSHTANTEVHLTPSEKSGLTEASTITSMAGYDLSQATATAIDPLVDTLLTAIAKLEKRIYNLEHPNP